MARATYGILRHTQLNPKSEKGAARALTSRLPQPTSVSLGFSSSRPQPTARFSNPTTTLFPQLLPHAQPPVTTLSLTCCHVSLPFASSCRCSNLLVFTELSHACKT
ncbi:hypothetical protein CRG98_004432 [Punica granatum]|uniref:Uncharacterized protein n=1 Tax=Punica granatum TaxID=22663 RepID=A0A2I0L3D0_PUNGR|nr:hypothetical protein CRG98_004432 [Punica granatum]